MAKALVVVYYHALSRRARRYAHAYAAFFEAQHYTVVILASSASRHQDSARLNAYCQGALECIVIGGDGSMNIAANVLASKETALTAIPLGTGNDFATSQGLTRWRWRMHHEVTYQRQSLGLVLPAKMYFVNHIGCGLSVDLMALQPPWLKRLFGQLSYSIALLRYLFGRDALRSRIRFEKQWDDGQIVALGPCIGGGIRVHPNANRQRPMLAFIRVPKLSRLKQLRALFSVWRGRIAHEPTLTYQTGTEFIIGDSEHQLELDGDVYFHGPVTVTAVDQALVVTLPATAATNTGEQWL